MKIFSYERHYKKRYFYNVFNIEAIDMIFYHVLSEAILYQGKPLDLSNTLINSQYLEKLICQDLVLQSIVSIII